MKPGTVGWLRSFSSGDFAKLRTLNSASCPGCSWTVTSVVHTRSVTVSSGPTDRNAHVSAVSPLSRTAVKLRSFTSWRNAWPFQADSGNWVLESCSSHSRMISRATWGFPKVAAMRRTSRMRAG